MHIVQPGDVTQRLHRPRPPVLLRGQEGITRLDALARAAGIVDQEDMQKDGIVVLPQALLAGAGLDTGGAVIAYSDGDGRIVIRRQDDALADLLTC